MHDKHDIKFPVRFYAPLLFGSDEEIDGLLANNEDDWMKMSRENTMRLTQWVTNLAGKIPVEFQRQLFQFLGTTIKWKATEFRFILLYCRPIILKDLLPIDQYNHFLYVHVALRILSSNKLCRISSLKAKDYLTRFILKCGKLYNLKSLVLNIHALIHLADDVMFFGCS